VDDGTLGVKDRLLAVPIGSGIDVVVEKLVDASAPARCGAWLRVLRRSSKPDTGVLDGHMPGETVGDSATDHTHGHVAQARVQRGLPQALQLAVVGALLAGYPPVGSPCQWRRSTPGGQAPPRWRPLGRDLSRLSGVGNASMPWPWSSHVKSPTALEATGVSLSC
jgi:hypothetical protein